MIAQIKAYGYLILSGIAGALFFMLKLSRMQNKKLEKQRDTYKAYSERQHKIAVKQKEVRQEYKQRLSEVTKDEETMDDRLSSGDNWSDRVSGDSSRST